MASHDQTFHRVCIADLSNRPSPLLFGHNEHGGCDTDPLSRSIVLLHSLDGSAAMTMAVAEKQNGSRPWEYARLNFTIQPFLDGLAESMVLERVRSEARRKLRAALTDLELQSLGIKP
jgi:hypothetical protein